jgi:beta-aspartyl-dipeptidase (metallo-type)
MKSHNGFIKKKKSPQTLWRTDMLTLIKQADVYAPEPIGRKDVLIVGEKIGAVREEISAPQDMETEIMDAAGMLLVPGLVDSHVHVTGGGGEGGYRTRTPEIRLTDITRAGVTTVVGCLGTDSATRSMRNLLAKTRALHEEGITAYCYTGSYQVPVKTLTGSIQDDLVFLDRVIGVGEIAVSDHRSSQPTFEELAKIAAAARIGGMLSGKAGIVNVHVGGGKDQLRLLERMVNETEIPVTQFLPTHLNRSPALLDAALDFAKQGGFIDFTAILKEDLPDNDFIPSSRALKLCLEAGISPEQIGFSSDGQGSLPVFDENGALQGLGVGSVTSLFEEVRNAVLKEHIDLETALQPVTSTPAKVLALRGKGRIHPGADADLVVLDRDMRIHTVMARGQTMILDKKILVKGTFEEQPQAIERQGYILG